MNNKPRDRPLLRLHIDLMWPGPCSWSPLVFTLRLSAPAQLLWSSWVRLRLLSYISRTPNILTARQTALEKSFSLTQG